jgi:hypothetical protein
VGFVSTASLGSRSHPLWIVLEPVKIVSFVVACWPVYQILGSGQWPVLLPPPFVLLPVIPYCGVYEVPSRFQKS